MTAGLLLTAQERDRFAAWLENEARTADALVEQMLKLGPHAAVIARREIEERDAARIIARKLRQIEDQTIG